MRRIVVAALSMLLLTGCSAITDFSRSLQSLETNRVPVEGTDEANRMHDLLAVRPDSAEATKTMNALLTETTGPIGAIFGGRTWRTPKKGLDSSRCDTPYGGLTKVQQFEVNSIWEAPGTLSPEAKDKVRAIVRAAAQGHGMDKERATNESIDRDEGKNTPIQQFSLRILLWDDDRTDPPRTNASLTVKSGCVRD